MNHPSERLDHLLQPVLETLGLALDAGQLALLVRQFALLLRWNRKMNLTSVRDPLEIAWRHFGESLFVAKALPVDRGTLVDIGSGPGFPGFPIAVAKPGLRITLVESVGKKAAFLGEVSRSVDNVRVFQGRFEDIPEKFDWGVIRGVAFGTLLDSIILKISYLSILAGTEVASTISRNGAILWQEPIAVPWEPTRVLMLGRST